MSFVLIGTMIVLNLFIGVIMTSMEEAQAEAKELDEAAIRAQHVAEGGKEIDPSTQGLLDHLDDLSDAIESIRTQLLDSDAPTHVTSESRAAHAA